MTSSTNVVQVLIERNIQRAFDNPQLPPWPEHTRGVPNPMLRSALFGVVRRGKRPFMEQEVIATLQNISIVYTGPRLDQSDLDVWEGVLHLARLGKLGDRIYFTEKAFLRLLGRGGDGGKNLGKSDREWLRRVLARLSATNVEIKEGPFVFGGSLIDKYFRDEESGKWIVILDPGLKAIFNNDGWTQVDWGVRHALQGHPLAQWLHGFYSTHDVPFPYKIETLHRLCGSETGENSITTAERNRAMLGWRDESLRPAFEALEKAKRHAGQHIKWGFDGNLVKVSHKVTTVIKKRGTWAVDNRGGQNRTIGGDRIGTRGDRIGQTGGTESGERGG